MRIYQAPGLLRLRLSDRIRAAAARASPGVPISQSYSVAIADPLLAEGRRQLARLDASACSAASTHQKAMQTMWRTKRLLRRLMWRRQLNVGVRAQGAPHPILLR